MSPTRSIAAALSVILGATILLGACGSRGPLDDTSWFPANGTGDDASVDSSDDALANADSSDASADVTDAAQAADAHEGGIAQCGLCVAQQCGSDVLQCLTDSTCR